MLIVTNKNTKTTSMALSGIAYFQLSPPTSPLFPWQTAALGSRRLLYLNF